jgi:hypothetical protein
MHGDATCVELVRRSKPPAHLDASATEAEMETAVDMEGEAFCTLANEKERERERMRKCSKTLFCRLVFPVPRTKQSSARSVSMWLLHAKLLRNARRKLTPIIAQWKKKKKENKQARSFDMYFQRLIHSSSLLCECDRGATAKARGKLRKTGCVLHVPEEALLGCKLIHVRTHALRYCG